MVTIVILTLLAILQAVFGHPVNISDFYDLNRLSLIVVSHFPATAP